MKDMMSEDIVHQKRKSGVDCHECCHDPLEASNAPCNLRLCGPSKSTQYLVIKGLVWFFVDFTSI